MSKDGIDERAGWSVQQSPVDDPQNHAAQQSGKHTPPSGRKRRDRHRDDRESNECRARGGQAHEGHGADKANTRRRRERGDELKNPAEQHDGIRAAEQGRRRRWFGHGDDRWRRETRDGGSRRSRNLPLRQTAW